MTLKQAAGLPCGLYRVWWKNDRGGSSLAAVGMKEDGTRWLAPTNWVEPSTDRDVWRMVRRVRPIMRRAGLS